MRVPEGFGGPANPDAEKLLDLVRSRGVAIRTTVSPETWIEGGVGLAVQHPPAGWYPEAPDNARSLVIDVSQAGRHLLLTGDVEGLGLVAMMARPSPDPPPDFMLSPHHGGRTANPVALYRWARPRAVVVSQRANREGVADALSPIEQQGTPIWRTGRSGAIRLRWTDTGIAASGFRDADESGDGPRLGRMGVSGRGPSFPLAVIGVGWLPVGFRLAIGLLGFAVGLILWAVVTIVEFGAWYLVVPPRGDRRRRQADAREAPKVADRSIAPDTIDATAADGVRLEGWWYAAHGAGRVEGTVLLLHGFAEDPSAWESARAAVLNAHGWNVAAIDSRGYGRSGGLYASFGALEAGDVSVWLDAIARRLDGEDTGGSVRIAVWGRSMGAAVAMRAAAGDARIRELVLEAPMVDLERSVAVLLRRRGLRGTRLLARWITGRAGRIAGASLRSPRPLDVASRVGCRALILHGTDDWLVPAEDVRRLAAAFPSSPGRIEVPGAGHSNVLANGGEELLGRILEFLDGPTRIGG